MSSVLVAEGEPRIASFVKKGLDASGFTTLVATDCEEAVSMSRRLDFDLVVLDAELVREMPGIVEELRGIGRVPVVMLTKRDLIEAATHPSGDRADEYLRKPFRMSDLLAHVSRLVRSNPQAAPTVLRRHGAMFDRENRRLTLEGRVLDLTPREAALIDLVFRDADQELTAEQLITRLRSLLT